MENQFSIKSLTSHFALLLGLAIGTSSCEYLDGLPDPNIPPGQQKGKVFYGPATPIGEGVARAWVSTDKQGTPLSVGVNISERVVQSLREEPGLFTLDLPKQAEGTLYEHITLDWNPQGHPPEGTYTLPHFDLHFYMISEEKRTAIPPLAPFDENGELQFDELPAPAYVPEDYVPDPGIIPNMGVHWLDPEAGEHHGETFTHSFIYGSYDGEFIFHEPMFTVAYLNDLKQMDHQSESYGIKQPERYQMEGYYPMEYSLTYNPTPGEYIISLDKLSYQQ